MKDLVNILQDNPSIEKVYFDDNGGWLFVPNKNHTNERTRSQVIDHWNSMTDAEKIEAYGLNSGVIQEEVDPDEQYRLLEEENELLKNQLGQQQSRIQELEKLLSAAEKKIKKQEKSE